MNAAPTWTRTVVALLGFATLVFGSICFIRSELLFGVDAFRTLARVPIGLLGAGTVGLGVSALVAAGSGDVLRLRATGLPMLLASILVPHVIGFNIGALSVFTDETPTSPGQVLSVARITHPIFSQSRFGFIFTNGDPTGLTRNTVAGADFNYLDTTTIPGKTLTADFYYERSFSNTVGDDNSYGVAFNFPNEPWYGDLTYKVVGENFDPALGFVNRPGIILYDTTVGYLARFRGRTDWLRTLELQTRHEITTDRHNTLQTCGTQMTPDARATGFALFSSAIYVGQTVGVGLSAIVFDRAGAVPLLVVAGLALPAMAVWFARELRRRG